VSHSLGLTHWVDNRIFPDCQVLDECTSAVSSEMERRLYAICLEHGITVRAVPGRLSAISVFSCKSVLYGAFVWARRALIGQKRRFPARAVRHNLAPPSAAGLPRPDAGGELLQPLVPSMARCTQNNSIISLYFILIPHYVQAIGDGKCGFTLTAIDRTVHAKKTLAMAKASVTFSNRKIFYHCKMLPSNLLH
jgi:hypothetical protein